MDRRALGRYGEAAAERYLASRGYAVLDRGWRTHGGEIDLVARKGGEVVFVEVKTRYPGDFGDPEEAVTPAKRSRLRLACYAWLDAHPGVERYRIDVVAVMVEASGAYDVRHIRDAVEERG
jgi:putative endonuclease